MPSSQLTKCEFEVIVQENICGEHVQHRCLIRGKTFTMHAVQSCFSVIYAIKLYQGKSQVISQFLSYVPLLYTIPQNNLLVCTMRITNVPHQGSAICTDYIQI